jgi:hypothetical protein
VKVVNEGGVSVTTKVMTKQLCYISMTPWMKQYLFFYAPDDADTDEKKQYYFLKGLNDGLAYALEVRDF